MENIIKENGEMVKEKAMVYSNHRRALPIMDNGKMTKNGEWEHKLIPTHQCIKVLLGVIKEKEKESIRMQTGINIKVIG